MLSHSRYIVFTDRQTNRQTDRQMLMVTISSLVSLVEALCGNTIILWKGGVSVSGTCNCITKKPIIVYDSGTGANVELDFSLAHPFSSDTVVRASREDRFAAAKTEEKYSNQQNPGSCKATFIPLIFKHFGC